MQLLLTLSIGRIQGFGLIIILVQKSRFWVPPETQAIPGVLAPLEAGRRSVALNYSAAFLAAALRVPVFFRAGAFVPAFCPSPSDFASSERFAA